MRDWKNWALALANILALTTGAYAQRPTAQAEPSEAAYGDRQVAEAQCYHDYYAGKILELGARQSDLALLNDFTRALESDLRAEADEVSAFLNSDELAEYLKSWRSAQYMMWYGDQPVVAASVIKPNDSNHAPGLSGNPREVKPNDSDEDKRSAQREVEVAKTLAETLQVVQQPDTKGEPEPYNTHNADYRINGEIVELYSPNKRDPNGIIDKVVEKSKEQAPVVIVDLDSEIHTVTDINKFIDRFRQQIADPKVNERFSKLKELWLVDDQGIIVRIYPAPANAPERIAPPKSPPDSDEQ